MMMAGLLRTRRILITLRCGFGLKVRDSPTHGYNAEEGERRGAPMKKAGRAKLSKLL